EAFAVIDRIADELSALWIDFAGLLVDLSRRGFVNIDAINRAGFGAHVAGDALVGLELMDAAIARCERQSLLRILNGDRFLKAVLESDLHPDRDGFDVVVDVAEVIAGAGHGRDYCESSVTCHWSLVATRQSDRLPRVTSDK